MIRLERLPQLRRRQVLRIATAGALAVLAAEVMAVMLPFIGTKPALFGACLNGIFGGPGPNAWRNNKPL